MKRGFWSYITGLDNKDYITVEDTTFNPTKELIDTLKTRISDLLDVVESKDKEIELLRRENLTLQAKLTNLPTVKLEAPKKHYVTVSAAKAELERKSLEMKRNQELEIKKSSTH